jgi:hypothetical protein
MHPAVYAILRIADIAIIIYLIVIIISLVLPKEGGIAYLGRLVLALILVALLAISFANQ